MKKRFLTGVVTAGLVLSMAAPAFATELTIKEIANSQTTISEETAADLSSFSDLQGYDWAKNAIMAMTNKGLFSGTGKITNGVGTFAPAKTMTRAEFVTVVVRALYNDELSKMPSSGGPNWWENSYDLAVEKGILKSSELDNGTMDKGMSRQEMALVLVRATEQLGQSPSQLVSTGKIADYSTVGTYYKDSVVKAYSMGMLAGTDAKGTYAPQATMNRAQGAAVLNRLVDSSSRIKVDFSVPSNPVSSSITIYEGQARSNRPAQAGDTFVKADGTKVVLQKDQYGIVGGGQGVAPDIGLNYNGEVCKDQGVFTYDNRAVSFTDSLGKELNNQTYMINRTTGTGHWGSEWQYLESKIARPTSPGSKDGEVSKDVYRLYKWDSIMELWMSNAR